MTKSQNTKNEQQNSGWYYVKCLCENEDRIDYYNASFGCWTSNGKYIKQVLAPVPSYDEWQALNQNLDSTMQTNKALCKKLEEAKELLRIILSKIKICYSMVFQKDIINAELNEALLKKIKEVLK